MIGLGLSKDDRKFDVTADKTDVLPAALLAAADRKSRHIGRSPPAYLQSALSGEC